MTTATQVMSSLGLVIDKSRLWNFIVGTVLVSVSLKGQNTEPPKSKVAQATESQPSPTQPIPFSHKLHAHSGLQCLDCHEMPPPGWDMTYPAEEKCMQCHASIKAEGPAIMTLAGYYKERKPVPWVQIYKVPDYVYFSHKTHYKKAGIDCEVCHGPVAERDVISKEKPTSMAACVDCHKERGARLTCRTCHER